MSEPRVMRVFVSSTFRDMRAERDELVKRVFPGLRKLCELRGVTWGEVDLRWGITDEQAAEGAVLPICLEEIRNCRPYFIGLLGERYGWVPERIDSVALEREPWLAQHAGSSITELEILHGVLSDPAMADHAFFYLRDPAQSARRPEFLEGPEPAEIARWGEEEAARRAADRRARLAVLKQRLRASSLPVREDFQDPEDLARLVLADLTAVIEQRFPLGEEPDAAARERALHVAFARSRLGVYVEPRTLMERLDAHAAGVDEPLAVVGESGVGKSALLANWVLRRLDQRHEAAELVVMHFIGASSAAADWATMVRRLIAELGYELDPDTPNEPAPLRRALSLALALAAARYRRVVIVIDALDKLEDRDGALDLAWLPVLGPANVRMIVSSLPGRPLDELARRGWPTLSVVPLAPDERRGLAVAYLAQYRKTLPAAELERIVDAPQAGNPLFLRTLLEELRLYGEHETLRNQVDHHLTARTIDDLYEQVLARYEHDYERGRPGLVRDAMSWLWAARQGLSEAELLDMLGDGREPLPAAYWAPLHLAGESSLISRGGLLGFAHDFLRTAVADRYLPTDADRVAAHTRIASYFRARELSSRKIDELPWQLARAQDWAGLYEVLGDEPTFLALAGSASFDLRRYWAQVEEASRFRVIDALPAVLAVPTEHPDAAWRLAWLQQMLGHNEDALSLQRQVVAICRERGDRVALARAIGNDANMLRASGDYDGALAGYQENESLCRQAARWPTPTGSETRSTTGR